MPERPAGRVRRGDHVKVAGEWRLVHGTGIHSYGMVCLEVSTGQLHSTDMQEYAATRPIPVLRPGEWVDRMITKHREHASGVKTRYVGPVERLARGLPPRPL